MARSRNIKPGFFLNEQLAELPYEARLLFIGLWTLADRDGKLEERQKRIEAELFPYDLVNAETLLGSLEKRQFICRYMVSGHRYILIPNFSKHQNPHKHERPSEIPNPPQATDLQEVGNSPEITGLSRDITGLSPADSLLLIPDSLLKTKARSLKFALPSLGEIQAYCQERNNHVDPQQFFDYYTANGWKVGRNLMRDWRAAVRNWERNDFRQGEGERSKPKIFDGSTRPDEAEGPPDPKCARCKGAGSRETTAHPGQLLRCECTYPAVTK